MSTVDERIGDFFRNMVSGRKCLVEILASTKKDSEMHKSVSELNKAFEDFLDVCDAWDYDVDESAVLSAKIYFAKQSGDWSSPTTWKGGEVPSLGADESHVIIIPDGVTVSGAPMNAAAMVTFSTQTADEMASPEPAPATAPVATPAPVAPPAVQTVQPEPTKVQPEPAPAPATPVPIPVQPEPAPMPEPHPSIAPPMAAVALEPGHKIEPKRKKEKEASARTQMAWKRKKIPIGVIARSVSKRRHTRRK